VRAGIFAKTFAGSDPRAVLGAARRAGFRVVQYNMACSGLGALPERIGEEEAAAVREAAREAGVEIAAVSATYNMAHPDAGARRRGLAGLRAIAGAARAMGTGLVTVCTGTRDAEDMWRAHPDNGTAEAWRTMMESMAAAVEIAEEFGVEVGVEPEPANVVSTAEKARRLIGELGSGRVRVVLDGANLFEGGSVEEGRKAVERGIGLLGEWIAIAHAKDRRADGSFAAAGVGVLDYGHYVGRLRAAGFRGPLIAHGLQEEDAPRVARFLEGHLRGSSSEG
jgi:sugar phosphate isomerase/epimerase